MTTPTSGVRPAEPLRGTAAGTGARAVVRTEHVVRADVVKAHLSRLTGHGGWLDVVAPATVATVRESTTEDVAAVAARARAVQQDWAARSSRSRARVVLAVHDLVLARREELTDLVQLVTGKARADAYLEVVGVLQGDTVPALLAGNAVLLKPNLRSTPLAGQNCTSSERLYVHADVADRFTRAFVAGTEALRLGWRTDHQVDLGSLVSPQHVTRVLAHVHDATARGARVLTGGTARPDLGPSFMAPTVLADVPPDALCAREETFGPLVWLQVVADDEAALAAMNDTEAGLMASVWRVTSRAPRPSRPGSAPARSWSTRCTWWRGAPSRRPSAAGARPGSAAATASRGCTR